VTSGGRLFTVAEARSLMPDVMSVAAEIAFVRAELIDIRTALSVGSDSPHGGLADAKAREARLAELIDWYVARDIIVKGWAPVLVDFPAVIDGADVYLCWLENEPELGWYHRLEHGFAGRRPIAASDE
jgi:hypothetical protein